MTINIYKTPNVMLQSLPSPQSTELKEVLENYVAGLQELTDSAKVPINILTMVAEENKIVASDIVQIIEARLQTAPPEHRLATLHLLDSIIKNVKEPYLSLFAQNIIANFVSTFNVVNIKTQESMIRLLQTWKEIYPLQYAHISTLIARAAPPAIPKPNQPNQPAGSSFGSFPPSSKPFQPIQEKIPYQTPTPIPTPTPSLTPLPLPTPISAASLTSQSSLPFIGQMPSVTHTPAQPFPQPNQNEILQQLYDRLREQLFASQIAAFQSNVPQNISSPSHPSILSPTHPSYPSHPTTQQTYSTPSIPNDYFTDQPKQTQQQSRYKQKSKNRRSPTHSPSHSSIRSPTQSPTRSSHRSPTQSPTHPSSRSPSYPSNPSHSYSQRTHLVDLKDQTNIDNKNKSISIGTSFSGDVLRRKQPHIINHLYNASWSQCPSCAFRFADPNKLSDHLDWHFKMNRREKEKYKKPLSREWFVPADEWITYEYFETIQKPSTEKGGGFFDTPSVEETKEKKKLKTIVKVDGHGVTCPVCSEGFKSFYDSEEDEWMYKDAVDIDGVLYHDDCSPDQPFEGLGKREEHPTKDRDFPYKLSKLDY